MAETEIGTAPQLGIPVQDNEAHRGKARPELPSSATGNYFAGNARAGRRPISRTECKVRGPAPHKVDETRLEARLETPSGGLIEDERPNTGGRKTPQKDPVRGESAERMGRGPGDVRENKGAKKGAGCGCGRGATLTTTCRMRRGSERGREVPDTTVAVWGMDPSIRRGVLDHEMQVRRWANGRDSGWAVGWRGLERTPHEQGTCGKCQAGSAWIQSRL